MSYVPADGDAILFEFSGYYTPAAGDQIHLSNVIPEPELRQLSPDFAVPWGEMERLNRLLGTGWNERRFVTRTFSTSHRTLAVIERASRSGWRQKEALDETLRSGWKDLTGRRERETSSPWLSIVPKDRRYRVPWSDSKKRPDRRIIVGYGHPPPMERAYNLLHGNHPVNDIIIRSPYINRIPWKDVLHRTMWGPKFYAEVCWRHYRPPAGDKVKHNLHLSITHVGDKDHIDFFFDQYTYDRRCVWREPSGWRDAYFYIPPGLIPEGPYSTVYTMINTAYLTRLPDRAPIDVSSITVSTDWDSVYWSVKAYVGSDAHLAMLESTEDGPILIETAINGHTWNFQVDKWGTGRAFGSISRNIDGRSVSAQLGAPAAELRTRTETEQRSAQQLMAAELENTGWAVIMAGDDWLVPGNTFSYADQTPMQIIKTIADTAGAMVYTDMTAKTITVKPRYAVPPWNWPSTPASIIIPSSMAEKIDGEWDERPFYNAVFVSGEANGISAKVSRGGTAGDLIAPMVTDKLLTATEPVRARGISILAASGKWSKYRVDLPVFPPPAVPGVILPGTILQFVDGLTSWKGIVTAVSVRAGRGKNGLKVRQALDVERYHGN
jgi:hypothetical protein